MNNTSDSKQMLMGLFYKSLIFILAGNFILPFCLELIRLNLLRGISFYSIDSSILFIGINILFITIFFRIFFPNLSKERLSLSNRDLEILIELITLVIILTLIFESKILPDESFNYSKFNHRTFAAILWAPLSEEIFYRLILINYLMILTQKKTLSVIFPSILFGLLHFTIIQACLYGLFLGFIYIQTRNILLPIAFHFLNNSALQLGKIGLFPDILKTDSKFVTSLLIVFLILIFVKIIFGLLKKSSQKYHWYLS
ncbi:CPBP family intramembrane metalloprotease [bacterium]|nr:CPBP family intramembrane metalloprotease [bacterium]